MEAGDAMHYFCSSLFDMVGLMMTGVLCCVVCCSDCKEFVDEERREMEGRVDS